jgi:hypothetical protein
MQDEYVKAIEKIQMNKDRKIEMRKFLENEMASATTEVKAEQVGKRAKTTRLSKGAKAGIAAAAIAATMGVLMAVPSSRNAINASIRAFFNKEVPQGATDGVTKASEDKKDRVIPTNDVDPSVKAEIESAVASQDKAEEDYYKNVTVTADYYKDTELNKLANYYAQQKMNLLDLKKDSKYNSFYNRFQKMDWFSDGFFVTYWVGDNATGHSGTITCFKATDKQMEGYLKNSLELVNYERKDHNQKTVTFDKFWKKTTDSEGNTVYSAEWKGPEPETKLLPSDSARFMTFKVTYDAKTQIAIAHVEEGGGVG